MANTKKTEAEQKPVVETKDDDKVTIMIPYVEGEDKEVTVWVNDDKIVKIKKGYQVKVTRDVAQVLENSNQQMMVAMENRERLKNQHQEW